MSYSTLPELPLSPPPEPDAVFRCRKCHAPIYDGDTYVSLYDDQYHEDCFDDDAVLILHRDYGAVSLVADAAAEAIYG